MGFIIYGLMVRYLIQLFLIMNISINANYGQRISAFDAWSFGKNAGERPELSLAKNKWIMQLK